MLASWTYLAIGVALIISFRRLGSFVYRLQIWPSPVDRRRLQVKGEIPQEHIAGERRRQWVFLALGIGFLILGGVSIIQT